jgi:hypothetical protein
VWGSEFTSKYAKLQVGSSRNRCFAAREIVGFGAWWWCWRDPRFLEARAEVLCRRRQRYKHGSVVERPQQFYGQQFELIEGISPRGLIYHCTEKTGYIAPAPLYICRVVLFLLRQRCGAGLGELQRARGRTKYFATAPAHT